MTRLSAKEVADKLGFSVTNLKNYANLLEQNGYEIHRNVKNHREYTEDDLKTLQAMIYLNKQKSMLLDEAASFVTSSDTDINDILSQQQVATVSVVTQESDNFPAFLNVISDVLKEQKALKEELARRDLEQLEQLQAMNEKLSEQAMLLETMKAEIERQKNEENKGFWARLFG